MVADSLSFYEHEPWTNDVAVGASFAGVPTAAMAMSQGVKARIAHEAGPGKDEAGVSGLPFADRYGVPAAAIATGLDDAFLDGLEHGPRSIPHTEFRQNVGYMVLDRSL